METGMRRWLMLAAAGLTAVALLGLPPKGAYVPSWRNVSAQEELSRDLSSEIRALNEGLRAVRVQDSLRAVLAAAEGSSPGIVLGHAPSFEVASRVRVVEDRLASDVEALPDRDRRVVLGAFWVPAGQGLHPGVARITGTQAELTWHGGRLADGRPYCAITISADPDHAWRNYRYGLDLPAEGSRLGPCAWWARFGPPGASVERWLARGGAGFTVGESLRASERLRIESAAPGPFGTGGNAAFGGSSYAVRCLSGDTRACELGFLAEGADTWALPWNSPPSAKAAAARDAALRAAGYVGSLRAAISWGPLGVPAPLLMADLEKEFGDQALRTFWTSDERVDHAFRSAFGVDAGTWTRDWLQGYYGDAVPSGSSMPRPANAVSVVLLLGVVAGLGGFVARRRQVV